MKKTILAVYGGTKIKYEMLTFSGGERHVQIDLDTMKEAERDLYIRANLNSSQDIIDLLLIHSAILSQHLQLEGRSLNFTLHIPYMPYARQDRVCAQGQAFSLNIMCKLINGMRPTKVFAEDIHSDVAGKILDAEFTSIAPHAIIRRSDELVRTLSSSDTLLICPDKGAVDRCSDVIDVFDMTPMVLCTKVRDPETGWITETKVDADDLTGKNCVIIDDICDGGMTFIKIAETLQEKNADRVTLYVTHGIFSKGIEVFDNLIDDIYAANMIPSSINETNDLIKVK